MKEKRETWTSNLVFTLSVAGAAVGLGNIWRFPYLVGANGGGAFVLIFVLCIFLIGIPLLIAEMAIGRTAGTNTIDAFKIENAPKIWRIAGYSGMAAAFTIMAYYSVLAGWVVGYSIFSIIGTLPLHAKTEQAVFAGFYSNFVSNGYLVGLFTALFLLMNYFVLVRGIRGIGRLSTILIPTLFVIIIVIAIRSLTFEGAWEGVKFYLYPDFSKVTGKTFLTAIGQVFFSFSIGFGVAITFASYMKKSENIPQSAFFAGTTDLLIALLAGFMIFPAVFAFGLNPAAGTSLVFQVLPVIFSQMPFGSIVAFMFFFLLIIAAFTSAVANYEVMITILIEKCKLTRKKAVIYVIGTVALFGNIPSILAFGVLKDITFYGMNFFDLFDYISGNILPTFTAFVLSLFVGWVIKDRAVREITNDGTLKFIWLQPWIFIIRFIAPIAILVIFYNSL